MNYKELSAVVLVQISMGEAMNYSKQNPSSHIKLGGEVLGDEMTEEQSIADPQLCQEEGKRDGEQYDHKQHHKATANVEDLQV